MFTEHEIKSFLQQTLENPKFINFDFNSTERFLIQLKCKIETNKPSPYYNDYIVDWIEKFSKFTASTWIVRNTFPKLKRMAYRKVYACHRSAFNKKKTYEGTRNMECKAIIDFKIKFINRNTMKNDPLLRQNLNLNIRIAFLHSHKVGARESFNLLRSTTDTDNVFFEYFESGHTPMVAKLYHEMVLIDKYGQNSINLSNATINPKGRHVIYLYNKRKTKQGLPIHYKVMAAKKEKIEKAGGTLCYENRQIVIVVTPIMKRILTQIDPDVVIIDSTLVSPGNVATFLYVPSKIGALCIASVLHTEQTEASYSQIFFGIKVLLENECNKNFEPKNIIANNIKEERGALEAIFPNSNVTISPWSLASEVWEWICEDENKIDRKKRINYMLMFNSMLHADSFHIATENYEKLNTDEYVIATPNLQKYLDTIWTQHDQWTLNEVDYKNKLVEISIRIHKEFLIGRCKTFNIYAMVDVVSNIMESHFRQILLTCAREKAITSIYTKFLDKSAAILEMGMNVIQNIPHQYRIENTGVKTKKYIRFRTDIWYCDCISGRKGQFCEHLCGIMNTPEVELKVLELSEDDKVRFINIAGGDIEEDDKIMETDGFETNEDSMELKKEKYDTEEQVDTNNDDDTDQPIANDDYYYLEIKKERNDIFDPLEEATEDNEKEINSSPVPQNGKTDERDFKSDYESALKRVNVEFRRLNKYFKENPNISNKETMLRLAKELSKIRPVERVNLNNMHIEVNSDVRQRNSSDDDED